MNFKNFLPRNPNVPSLGIQQWPSASAFPLTFMQLGNENGKKTNNLFELKNGLYEERANFWMELRANYSLNRWF